MTLTSLSFHLSSYSISITTISPAYPAQHRHTFCAHLPQPRFQPCFWQASNFSRQSPEDKREIVLFFNGLKELAYTGMVTEKCDVYSFGVVTLEVIMGKHHGGIISTLISNEDQHTLLKNTLDKRIMISSPNTEKWITLLAMVAFASVRVRSQERPTMSHINQVLVSGKTPTIHEPFQTIRLCQLLNF